MKKINKLFVAMMVGVLLNLIAFNTYAEQDPVWEFYQSGFEKFYFQNYSCDENGAPTYTVGGSQYCMFPYLVKEQYSGMTDNNSKRMVKDSQGNFYFAYLDYLVKHDGTNWQIFNTSNSDFKGPGEQYSTFNISEMRVDNDDNVWMATYEYGLMKLEGNSITIYDKDNSSIPEGIVADMEIDALNNIWLAIPEVGLVKFDGNSTFSVYDSSNTDIPNNNIHYLTIDGNDKIWAANANDTEFALAKFDGTSSWVLFDENNSNILDNDVNNITSDYNGNIWALSSRYSSHVCIVDITNDSITDHSDKYFTDYLYGGGNSFMGDSKEYMYFTGDVGMVRVNIDSLTHKSFGGGMYDAAYNVYVDDNDDVYFRKYDGIYSVINETDSIVFASDFSDIKNIDKGLTFDNAGNLWGISSGNLVKYDGTNWTQYDFPFHTSSMNPSHIQQFVIKSDDEIWMWYDGYIKGLATFDGTTWTEADTMPFYQIKDMVIDGDDNIWLSSWGSGIAKLEGGTWTIYDKSNSELPNDWIHAFNNDKQGNLWIDCFDGPMKQHNIVKFDGTTWTIYDSAASNGMINEEEMEVISSDYAGNMYFAYRIGDDVVSMIVFDGTTWTNINMQNSDLPANYIEDIEADVNGNIWISSYGWVIGEGGKWHLSKYDGTSFTNYDTELLGLSKNSIYSILPDGAGNVWMLNDGRLVKFNDGELNIISGKLFYDANDDCIEDTNETGMSGITVKLIDSNNPSNVLITTTNAQGYYFFNPEDGSYTVEPQLGDDWLTATDNSTPIVINLGTPSAALSFCIVENNESHDMDIHLTSNRARCFENTTMWIHYENFGTTVSNGTVSMQLDSLNTFVSAVPAPDANNNGLLTWNYTGLNPCMQENIMLTIQMPDFNAMGDTLVNIVTIEDENYASNQNDDYIYLASDTIESELRCSYDPNDKLVDEGVMEEKYVLFGEKLTYTIRFQNTGNDTAYIVVVKDTLDIANLDTGSFQFLSASHNTMVEFDENTGLVVFTLKDIMLVDSLTDEQGSQGFVKFTVRTKEVLAENTEVTNKAYIYFDFNPAIVTNEVLNTLVSKIPSKVSVNAIMTDNSQAFVYPNPVEDVSYIQIENPENINYTMEIFDITGKLHHKENTTGNLIKIERNAMQSGMYLYKLTSIDKTYRGRFVVK